MNLVERFLRYVSFDTQSDENSGVTPSTPKQMLCAQYLKHDLEALGLEENELDEFGYLYATLPANTDKEIPTVGFIAHMDTSPDMSGAGVTPRIVHNYDGSDIVLCEEENIVLAPSQFPELLDHKNEDLIVTNGKTLLGADDKAGIAEIMTLIERITSENIPHGKLCIAFTPDEEVGSGADHFDVEGFGARYAYTVDGGEEGSLEYENFNAAAARITVRGTNVHPGSAKNVMVNALLVAIEANSLLPSADTPALTEGYEGFYHLMDMKGDVESATLMYIIRDHSEEMFECRKKTLMHIAKTINEKYGEGTLTLEIRDQYRNMKEMIIPEMHLIDNAILAAKRVGLTPTVEPIRGGTDGARLSFMGLPCPNLGTGGYAFHGPFEHISVEGMDSATEMLLEIVKIYSAQK